MGGTIECPECANDIPDEGKIRVTCTKCGAQLEPRVKVFIKPHEFKNPVLFAQAHLRAATELLNSIA